MALLAQIGPLTTLLEPAATAIGAGIVVGGFFVAALGLLTGRSRKEMEATALRDGFVGGLAGMSCLCGDLLLRYL